jgi:hypothetical protein
MADLVVPVALFLPFDIIITPRLHRKWLYPQGEKKYCTHRQLLNEKTTRHVYPRNYFYQIFTIFT